MIKGSTITFLAGAANIPFVFVSPYWYVNIVVIIVCLFSGLKTRELEIENKKEQKP
jgi:hypothetical protein